MKLRYILVLLSPVLLLANGGESSDGTDIIPRAINFVIFASILYYLLADHVKTAYKGRISGIADSLNSIQVKVQKSLDAKDEALAKVEDAKANAKTLIETAQKESKLLVSKIATDTDIELQNLDKGFKDKIDIEKRRMVRSVVSGVLEEIFDKDSISINKEELVEIVMKKVA